MSRLGTFVAAGAVCLLALGAPAAAYDPRQTFIRGSVIVSPEIGAGAQVDVERHRHRSDLEFVNAGVRFGLLPFEPLGSGPLLGALEVGLEPFYQRYTEPRTAFFAGLAAVVRYHFLALGRFVPYAELAGAGGATDLRIPEIDSDFTFLLFAGAGASVFVADRTAVYAGYRFQHVSNGNVSRPNRGFESHTAVAGMSFFFE